MSPHGDWFNPGGGLLPGEQPFGPHHQQGLNQLNFGCSQQQDFIFNQQRQRYNQNDMGYNRNYSQKNGGLINQQNVPDFNNQQCFGSNPWNRNILNQSNTGTK